MRTTDITAKLVVTVKTEAQAREVAERLGVDPAALRHPKLEDNLAELALHLWPTADLPARLDRALDNVAKSRFLPATVGLVATDRLEAFLRVWPRDRKLPTPVELGAIVGATDKQVEAMLAVGTEEQS